MKHKLVDEYQQSNQAWLPPNTNRSASDSLWGLPIEPVLPFLQLRDPFQTVGRATDGRCTRMTSFICGKAIKSAEAGQKAAEAYLHWNQNVLLGSDFEALQGWEPELVSIRNLEVVSH